MHATGSGQNGFRLEDRLRLVIVDSPDVAAPLVSALDVAYIGAWMWVEAERALYFSPRVLDLLGVPVEPRGDLIARFFRGIHPDDQLPVRRLLAGQCPAGGFTLRYRFTPPGGPLRWIEDRGRVERQPGGELLRQGGALRDVTQEVGQELERRRAEARVEALVNAMPFAVWGRSAPDLTMTHQNEAAVALWGDLRGRTLDEAPADLRQRWEGQLADVMTGQIIRTRHEHFCGGRARVVQDIVAPVIVDDELTGAVGVTIDVSEEARAEKFQTLLARLAADFAHRPSETVQAGLAQALQEIARFLGARQAALCEVSEDEELSVTHWWIDPSSGADAPPQDEVDVSGLRNLFRQVARNTPVVIRSREQLPESSPERNWLAGERLQSIVIVPTQPVDDTLTILGIGGGPDEIVDWPPDTVPCMRLAATLFGGVLARGRAEEKQKTVERRMEKSQKLESLGVLAGGIAHDFNNLLTAILGHASLLRAEFSDSESILASLDPIEAAARRAAELCRQMLAYSGRGRFALQVIDLNDVIRGMEALLRVTVPKKARLDLQFAPALAPVLADAAQVQQLVMNLVLNAAEALHDDAGAITVRTRSGHRTARELSDTVFGPPLADGEYVSLSVSDTGEGMTPETLGKIFDPFFSTKFTGRGLGLAAVVGIVRAHHGALHVESERGTGSTFELILPAHHGPPTPSPDAKLPDADLALSQWRTGGTVLVVDDETGVRDLVQAVLERAGMTVIIAADGDSAVETFRQRADEIRLLLVDLTMPGLDGREALEEMRKRRADVPAILMSGYSPMDLDRGSAQAFLQKPFTPDALRSIVKRVLEGAH
jgi:signal transduction histidine kinase